MWRFLAETALVLACANLRRSRRLAAAARTANARAEWWLDVQAFADGAGPWAALVRRRRRAAGRDNASRCAGDNPSGCAG